MKKLSILGSTGSIGRQTLAVVRAFPRHFRVVGLSAGENVTLLARQIAEFKPRAVSVKKPADVERLKKILTKNSGRSSTLPRLQIFSGPAGLNKIASLPGIDRVVNALVGGAGAEPTKTALRAGHSVALACKEALVEAGAAIIRESHAAEARLARRHAHSPRHSRVSRHSRTSGNLPPLIPIDSEQSAIFQCLQGRRIEDIEKIILTCSGGPFLGRLRQQLKNVTAAQVLAHPRWPKMGLKNLVDSATLINKGLEVIEAHHLFGLPYGKIDVLIHPEAIVHGLVQFKDGHLLAHLSPPDMRLPIEYALFHPERPKTPWPKLDLTKHKLTFHKPDHRTFPGIKLTLKAAAKGSRALRHLARQDELAVQKFLTGEIKFLDIYKFL